MQKNKNPILFRIISLLLLLSWMGFVFYLSSQTATLSSAVSGGLIEGVIRFILPNADEVFIESTVSSLQFIVRKGAHFTIYTIMGILSFTAFVTYEKMRLRLRCSLAFLVSAGYSVTDEYHQTFIEGRSGELRDVLIDSSGVLLGILLSLGIYKIICVIKSKEGRKMKKKQYIELCENLRQRLQQSDSLNKELAAENQALISQINSLREELCLLKEKAEESKIHEEIPEEIAEEVAEEAAEPQPQAEAPKLPEPQLSPEIYDAAKIIGRIVLSAATYCNRLTTAAAGANAKELVNLILGRCEVAKAEILRISSLQIDQNEKLYAMKQEETDTEDYFKSVMAQK